jgi:FtsH-binding integral membrane protein
MTEQDKKELPLTKTSFLFIIWFSFIGLFGIFAYLNPIHNDWLRITSFYLFYGNIGFILFSMALAYLKELNSRYKWKKANR